MRTLAFAVLLGGMQLACGEPASIATPEAVLDSLEVVEAQSNLLMTIADGVQLVTPDEQIAIAEVAANLEQRFQPPGCARLTAQEYVHAITLEDCAGPRGLAHVTGTLTLGVLTVDHTVILEHFWSNVTINDTRLVDGHSSDMVGTSPDGHVLNGFFHSSSVGPRGNEVTQGGDYVLTLDASTECRSLVGTWGHGRTDIAGPRPNTMANVMRCASGCPVGTVSRLFEVGATVTVTLDGNPIARWDSTAGTSGTIDVGCP